MAIRRITLLRIDSEASNVYSGFSHPGLALPLIGTALKNAGYEVSIYVEAIQPPDYEELKKSDLVAFTVNSACFLESYALADRLRDDAGCPIVFGGPHVTFLPEEGLRHSDFVVRGEGEQTIVELVRAIAAGKTDFGRIPGVSWRAEDGRVRHNEDRPLEPDIDMVPDQSLVVGFRQFNRQAFQRLFPSGMLVSTSRGCPFRCTFCSIPQISGPVMRFRSHDAILADIRQQTEFSGHRYIYFADDNFTAGRKHIKQLLRRILDEKLDIRFSAQVRAETTSDPELMDLLRRAGCYLVFVGYESLNDATLKGYQKGGRQSASLIDRSVEVFHQHGIMIHGMFVLGADEDTPGTAVRTAEWSLEKGLESLQILPICPLPGTQLLQTLDREGRVYKERFPETGEEYIPYGAGNYVLYEPRQMSSVELQQELIEAYYRFYSLRGVLGSALRVPTRGMDPFIIRTMGRVLCRRAEPEVRRHIRWLEGKSRTHRRPRHESHDHAADRPRPRAPAGLRQAGAL